MLRVYGLGLGDQADLGTASDLSQPAPALNKLFHCSGSQFPRLPNADTHPSFLGLGGGDKADTGRLPLTRSLVRCLAPGTGAGAASLAVTPLPPPPHFPMPSTLFHQARLL